MKYSINGWDYHGHHDVIRFEANSDEEALERFNREVGYMYGDVTLYKCPKGYPEHAYVNDTYIELKKAR